MVPDQQNACMDRQEEPHEFASRRAITELPPAAVREQKQTIELPQHTPHLFSSTDFPSNNRDFVFTRFLEVKEHCLRQIQELQGPVRDFLMKKIPNFFDMENFDELDLLGAVKFRIQAENYETQDACTWVLQIELPYAVESEEDDLAGSVQETTKGTLTLNPLDTITIIKSMAPRQIRAVLEGHAMHVLDLPSPEEDGYALLKNAADLKRISKSMIHEVIMADDDLRRFYQRLYGEICSGRVHSQNVDIVFTVDDLTSEPLQQWGDIPVGMLPAQYEDHSLTEQVPAEKAAA